MVAFKTVLSVFTLAIAAAAAPSNLAPRSVDPKQVCPGGNVQCCNGLNLIPGVGILPINALQCVNVLSSKLRPKLCVSELSLTMRTDILGSNCDGTFICCQTGPINQVCYQARVSRARAS
jgi:hypothetical protein